MNRCCLAVIGLMFTMVASQASADLVEYDFDITYQTVNVTGKEVEAMTVGGSIPAPTIYANEGDRLRVTFHNKMEVESSIHWHGILLPNDQDGVPYLTTPPIQPGRSLTYEYPIIQSGTYWYHSHTGLQEQRGVYGALVFYPKEQPLQNVDTEAVLVFSDWTNENPKQVLANLKKDGDYYALKKNAVQSWDKVISHGFPSIQNRIMGAFSRMGPMDVSDIGYDAFLVNGVVMEEQKNIKAGNRVLLRMINASASSDFYVQFAGGPMEIVAADGLAVMPQIVDRLKMSIAETYDVIVTIPNGGAYEIRATSEDGTGYSSSFLGSGAKHFAPTIPKPNPFIVDHKMHSGADTPMIHGQHRAKQLRMMQQYEGLRSVTPTTLPLDNPKREILLNLTGNMERYVWSFNNQTLKESDKILIRKGENIQMTFVNKTMMSHPLHLHGHFFRVLNGEGEYSPLKHTVRVAPMSTVKIEFLANEEKDWFFHCHNLYHMKNGMARVLSYEDNPNHSPLRQLFDKKLTDPWYGLTQLSFLSNMAYGKLRASNTRNLFSWEFDSDYRDEYEIELTYERNITRFLDLYVGAELDAETNLVAGTSATQKEEEVIIGMKYMLPFLIHSDIRLDSDNHFRFALESELQLTDRGYFMWEWNSDDEYRLSLRYDFTKKLATEITHDADFNFGAGFSVTF